MVEKEEERFSLAFERKGERLLVRIEDIPSVKFKGRTYFVTEPPSVIVGGKKYFVEEII
ncbi:MAG: hypothetical protein N3G22_01095 [Candidatus Micrarchaeota archaeon]|nr:hypothetical protein [Candidatus Micrarchaeota archaeon]